MIVTLGSIRGAPGVTSWSLLLAAAWPTDPEVTVERVVLEADLAGGVLGARYGWGVEPGVVSLISRLRRDEGGRALPIDKSARTVGDGVFLVPGPETGEQARSVWRTDTGLVAGRLATDPRVWFVDVGRFDEASTSVAFVDASLATVLVCGGRPEDLVQIPSRIRATKSRCDRIGLLVTGPCAHSLEELAAFSGADAVWLAKDTNDLAEAAATALADSRARRRSWLWRRALEIAAELSATTTTGSRVALSQAIGAGR
jgi:hypothetical protein